MKFSAQLLKGPESKEAATKGGCWDHNRFLGAEMGGLDLEMCLKYIYTRIYVIYAIGVYDGISVGP